MKYILIILVVILQSCITQEKCNERFPPQVKEIRETTYVKRDSVIPGAIIRDTLTLESIQYLKDVKIIKDTTGRAELRLYKDAYGRLIAECQAKDIDITWFEKQIKDYTEKINTVKEKYIPAWVWIFLGIILVPALVGMYKIAILILKSGFKFL